MKLSIIAFCLAGLLLLGGCEDDFDLEANNQANTPDMNNGDNGNDGNGNDNDGTGTDLQMFVLNNCGMVTSGMPIAVNGAMFPDNDTDDPSQSIYTRTCLNQ